jgi:hypothetical protein
MENTNNPFLKLDTRQPTTNMMLWMKYYDSICNRLCCHSTDCGTLRCSGCLLYLTTVPPLPRYQCIECEIFPPEATYNSRPEICEACFNNNNILHQHVNWLKVDEKGNHSIVNRSTGVCEAKTVNHSDFPIVSKELTSSCAICCCDFDNDNPPVSFPGCRLAHGNAGYCNDIGYFDMGTYNHLECIIHWYQASKRDVYNGELNYCELCRFESIKDKWISDFQRTRDYIDTNSDINKSIEFVQKELSITIEKDSEMDIKKLCDVVRDKLIDLHCQEWLRKIIVSIFN